MVSPSLYRQRHNVPRRTTRRELRRLRAHLFIHVHFLTAWNGTDLRLVLAFAFYTNVFVLFSAVACML